MYRTGFHTGEDAAEWARACALHCHSFLLSLSNNEDAGFLNYEFAVEGETS